MLYFSRISVKGGLRRHLTTINYPNSEAIAHISLQNGPVNSINLELMQKLKDSILEVESNRKAKAIVLCSKCRVFSAGLDLTQMHGATRKYLESFWQVFQDLWVTLYGSRLATVASLNGHALAGGCILALACDLRVINKTANIGSSKYT